VYCQRGTRQPRKGAQATSEGLELNDLAILGPIFVLKLKSIPDGFGRKLVAEMWLYPDGSRIRELSTKCLPGEVFQVQQSCRLNSPDMGSI
jgi:hypothetical protein